MKRWIVQYIYGLAKTFVITQSLTHFNISPLIISGILTVI